MRVYALSHPAVGPVNRDVLGVALSLLVPLLTAVDVEIQIVEVGEVCLFVWVELPVSGMS